MVIDSPNRTLYLCEVVGVKSYVSFDILIENKMCLHVVLDKTSRPDIITI